MIGSSGGQTASQQNESSHRPVPLLVRVHDPVALRHDLPRSTSLVGAEKPARIENPLMYMTRRVGVLFDLHADRSARRDRRRLER